LKPFGRILAFSFSAALVFFPSLVLFSDDTPSSLPSRQTSSALGVVIWFSFGWILSPKLVNFSCVF